MMEDEDFASGEEREPAHWLCCPLQPSQMLGHHGVFHLTLLQSKELIFLAKNWGCGLVHRERSNLQRHPPTWPFAKYPNNAALAS
jgi:hypothetical protein